MDVGELVREIEGLLAGGRNFEALRAAADLFGPDAPDHGAERRRVAALAERLGLVDPAAACWERLLADDPLDAEALRRLAGLRRAAGRVDDALELLRRWRSLAADDADPLRDELELLLEAGRLDQGRALVAAESARRDADDAVALELQGMLDDFLASPQEEEEGAGLFDERPAVRRAPAPAPIDEAPARVPTDAEVTRFLHRFAGREDVHARMWCDENGRVGYAPVREPLTPQGARNHLLGNLTLGVYPLRHDGRVSFFAVDLDVTKTALERAKGDPEAARRTREGIRAVSLAILARFGELGLPALMESSGYKGRHFWVFLDPPQPAARVYPLGRQLLALLDPDGEDLSLEFFPKQGDARGGIGNLIKLPLGVHLKTGRRSRLLDREGRPVDDAHELLRATPCADDAALAAAEAILREKVGPAPQLRRRPPERGVVREIPDRELGPAPPPPPPPWTEADFDRDPQVKALFERCAVLGALRRRIEEYRRVSAAEIAVLRNTIGHLVAGPLAVNFLLGRCEDVPSVEFMQSPLRGSPSSCSRIRQRVPHLAGVAACACVFDEAAGLYPTPLRHVEGIAATPQAAEEAVPGDAAGRTPEDLARLLGALERRRGELEEKIAGLKKTLLEVIAAGGRERVDLPEGAYVRRAEDGIETLVWVGANAASDAAGPAEGSGTGAA